MASKMNKLLRKPKVQYMGNIGHKRQTQIAKMMSNTDPTKVPEMNTGVHEFMVTFSRNIFSKSIFKDCCRKQMTAIKQYSFIFIVLISVHRSWQSVMFVPVPRANFSKLFSLPFSKLHSLYKSWLENQLRIQAYSSRFGYCRCWLFKPVGIKKDEINKHSCLSIHLPTKILMPITWTMSFITNQYNLKFLPISNISMFL